MADDWRANPTAVIRACNDAVRGRGVRCWNMSRAVIAEARKYGAWCIEHDVDPAAYVLARHEAIGYKFRFHLDKLPSPKFLTKFREFGAMKQAGVLGQARLARSVTTDPDPEGPELRSLWEMMKRTYMHEPELCMTAIDMTGGWNPRSSWCCECPIADTCKSRTPEAVRSKRSDVRSK